MARIRQIWGIIAGVVFFSVTAHASEDMCKDRQQWRYFQSYLQKDPLDINPMLKFFKGQEEFDGFMSDVLVKLYKNDPRKYGLFTRYSGIHDMQSYCRDHSGKRY